MPSEPPNPDDPQEPLAPGDPRALRRTRQYSDGIPPVVVQPSAEARDAVPPPGRPDRSVRADTLLEGQTERANLTEAVMLPADSEDRTATIPTAVTDVALEPDEVAVLDESPTLAPGPVRRSERATAEVEGPVLDTVRAALEPVPAVRVRLPALSEGRPTPREQPAELSNAASPVRTRVEKATAQELPHVRQVPWRMAGAALGLVAVGAVLAYAGIRALDTSADRGIEVPEPSPVEPAPPAPPVVARPEPEPAVAPVPPLALPTPPAPREPAPTDGPQPDRAEAWTHQVTGTAADPAAPYLALRQGPSAGATEVAELPDGTHLRSLSRQGRWVQVRVTDGAHEGQTGWVHARWLSARSR